MCGIAGLIHIGEQHEPPPLELLTRMIGAIAHRGPDEYGVYRDDHAGLAHARLSIIDIATGQQPLANENESLWIVFNGEIFNYLELREELNKAGHRFKTHSDTEVIVHSYEQWGKDCFAKFNGQWAIAMWDMEARQLIISRDRVGVRPLFLREHRGTVWFGSEVKAIFADESVPRAINLHGLDQTFTTWTSLAPVSVFEGIEELRPGTVAIIDKSGRRDFQYWQPTYPTDPTTVSTTLDAATTTLLEKLTNAAKLRMVRSDVPVGCYVSGGIDSSITARLGRDATDGELHTFSLRFDEPEFDETRYQQALLSTISSKHHELTVTRDDIAQVFPDVIRHAERPILRTAPAPMFLLSRLVRETGIKAVLTGEGADEMLAGYDLFREMKIRRFWSGDPDSQMRPKLFERIYPYLTRSSHHARGLATEFWKQGLDRVHEPDFSHHPRWRTTSSLKRFFSGDVQAALKVSPAPVFTDSLPTDFPKWDSLAKAQYIEVVTLLSGYIISSQGDRMLMANSVEGRFPFLDVGVMEFCNALPASYKMIGLNEKFILKRMARGLIPHEIIERPKQPYRAPDAICFVGDNAPDYVREALSDESVRNVGLFSVSAVRGLHAKLHSRQYQPGADESFSNSDNMGLVGILSTQLLYTDFIRNRGMNPAPIRFSTIVDKTTTFC